MSEENTTHIIAIITAILGTGGFAASYAEAKSNHEVNKEYKNSTNPVEYDTYNGINETHYESQEGNLSATVTIENADGISVYANSPIRETPVNLTSNAQAYKG